MGYYKFIKNDTVIAVSEFPVWVKVGVRGNLIRCLPADAHGVIFGDSDSVWHIAGAPTIGDGSEDVVACDISRDEFNELSGLLDIGASVNNDMDIVWPDNFEKECEPESAALSELKARKIAKLAEDCKCSIVDTFSPFIDESADAGESDCNLDGAQNLVMQHMAYYSGLKRWVQSMSDMSDVCRVQYGDPIPDAYASNTIDP